MGEGARERICGMNVCVFMIILYDVWNSSASSGFIARKVY